MLLLSGLIGLFVSGVMVAVPSPFADADADADQDDSPHEDAADEDRAGNDPEGEAASLLDMVDGPAVPTAASAEATSIAPASDAPADIGDPADGTGHADGGADDGTDELFPPRDALGSAHLTDRIQGSFVAPIHNGTDAMFGNEDADSLAGGRSDDMILGNGGDDRLSGGEGRDILIGGDGNDTLSGGDGDDALHGDWGHDHIDGGSGDDLLAGDDGNDMLIGGDGDDRLFGGEGADTLVGGAGNDILDGSVIEDGVDRDDGDRLIGGDGDDTLAGGSGDVLSGGAGADLYMFGAPSAGAIAGDGLAPLIEDFDPDEDAIEVAFDGPEAPQVRIAELGDMTELLVDDIVVARLAGQPGLTAAHVALVPAT